MHCFRQKQLLGSEVVSSLLMYVECGKNGANSRRGMLPLAARSRPRSPRAHWPYPNASELSHPVRARRAVQGERSS